MIKKAIYKILFGIVLSAALISGGASAQQARLATDEVKIETRSGEIHSFDTEMALTVTQQTSGMMLRKSIGPNEAMLFVYSEPARKQFWMRNTLIPLDIIFIREDGRIANIIRNAAPQTDDPRKSRGPAIGVFEIAGGRALELGIRPGDRVIHPLYQKKETP